MTFASETPDFRRGVEVGLILGKMHQRKPVIGSIMSTANKAILEGLAEAKGYEITKFNIDAADPQSATVVMERKR